MRWSRCGEDRNDVFYQKSTLNVMYAKAADTIQRHLKSNTKVKSIADVLDNDNR